MTNEYLTVTQLNKYIKYKFDTDENLNLVYLKGEISNFKDHTTGHLYFTLKDENSRILAVMFKNNAYKLNFKPIDGSKVLVIGKVSTYEANGNYQIYVEEMIEDGVGNLYLEFEKLKKKLEELGYFKNEHKKPIPKYPKKIGIITATTGAAIRDIITTINRRYKLVELYIFPCLVQGTEAKEDIVRNIELANKENLDVIILGRGGGSIEDLWAFNEEIVAKSIFDSVTPIISAVGHEIDFTISDFVADLRAPTPTAAAELAVPNTKELINNIYTLKTRCNKSLRNLYEIKSQRIDNILEKTEFYIKRIIELKTNKYLNYLNILETLNPMSTIKRGYSISRINNKIIKNIKEIKADDILTTEISNGKISSKIIKVEETNE